MNKKVLSTIVSIFFYILIVCSGALAQISNENETTHLDINNIYQYSKWNSSSDYNYWIKFTVLLDSSGKMQDLVFQNTNKFPFHADYLLTKPEFKGLSRTQINERTTRKLMRKAYVGTLFVNQLENNAKSIYEIISEDPIEISNLVLIQNRLINATSDYSKDLSYSPLPQFKEEAYRNSNLYLQNGIKLYNSKSNKETVCYTSGSGFGKVQVITALEYTERVKKGLIGPQDLIISDQLPRDIIPVAGIVVEQESSPSSHGALLGQMLGFPVAFQKEALKSWKNLDGKYVFINVNGVYNYCNISKLEIVNLQTIEKLLEYKKPVVSEVNPNLDESLTKITSIKNIKYNDVAKVGGKAANFSRLVKYLPAENIPQATVIPVSFYRRYIKEAKTINGELLIDYIQNQLKRIQAVNTPTADVLVVVKEIRDTLNKTVIPTSITNEIRTQLKEMYPNTKQRLKFRSSSNVEDLKSFNGAGLYDSKSICQEDLDDSAAQSACSENEKPDSIEKGLHKVWSSLYSDRAYLARRYVGVNESNLAMSILVQPSIKNELANGVAILEMDNYSKTYNISMTGFPGEDLEVVHPPSGKVPETALVKMSWNNEIQFEIVIPSTEIPKSRSLLENSEYTQLYKLMSTIANTWEGKKADSLDFEWKVIQAKNGIRKVVVKQVREVPVSALRYENQIEDILWLVPENQIFKSQFGESNFGLAVMKGNVQVEIKAPYISLKDLKSGNNTIESVKLTTPDNVYNYTNKDIRVTVTTTPWETIEFNGGGKPLSRRYNSISIDLPNHEVPSLRFVIQAPEVKSESNSIKSSINVFGWNLAASDFTSQQYLFSADKRDFLDFQDRIEFNKDYIWNAYDPSLFTAKTDNPPHDASETFVNKNIKVAFTSTSTMGGFDKTEFRDITQAEITGLLSKPFLVRNTKALVYAPAHHNFSWEYVVDLSHIETSDMALKKELVDLKARYLVISVKHNLGLQGALWSDQGKIKDLGKFEFVP